MGKWLIRCIKIIQIMGFQNPWKLGINGLGGLKSDFQKLDNELHGWLLLGSVDGGDLSGSLVVLFQKLVSTKCSATDGSPPMLQNVSKVVVWNICFIHSIYSLGISSSRHWRTHSFSKGLNHSTTRCQFSSIRGSPPHQGPTAARSVLQRCVRPDAVCFDLGTLTPTASQWEMLIETAP